MDVIARIVLGMCMMRKRGADVNTKASHGVLAAEEAGTKTSNRRHKSISDETDGIKKAQKKQRLLYAELTDAKSGTEYV